MGAQSIQEDSLESKKKFFEDKMIKEGEDFILFKYYHLGERPDMQKMIHIGNLFDSYSSKNCNVQAFLNKQFELDHNYLNVENSRMCEEFDVCYSHKK